MKVKDNTYRQLYVDVTQKCNMNCSTCYNPFRGNPDLDLEYFDEVCAQLPKRIMIRMVGGEPTITNTLFEAVAIARKHGHMPSIVTNGIRLSDPEYAEEFKKLQPIFVAISFDGGLNDDFHEQINGSRCLDKKLKALDNLRDMGCKRIILTGTIIRGLNESIIPDLLELTKRYPMIRYLHYRSQLLAGNYLDDEPYTLKELEDLVDKYTPIKNPYKVTRSGEDDICCGSCKMVWSVKGLEVSLVASNQIENNECYLRGYIREDFELEPFFKSMRDRNES